jgi:DNA-binding response OmpR family regulator
MRELRIAGFFRSSGDEGSEIASGAGLYPALKNHGTKNHMTNGQDQPILDQAMTRILVVEDEVGLATSIAAGLREERYVADLAPDGAEAQFLAETHEYDLIILDLILPKKSGFEVCRSLRKNAVKTPILMLTALDSISDKVKGLDCGADDYLTKPFSFDELLARVRALLRRGPLQALTALDYGEVHVDLLTHRVTRASREIELTAKEYALLEYFMRNPERVLTRAQLAEHVWDKSFDPFSNVIDVTVGHLRKKIAVSSQSKLIHAVRGMGYILKA